MPVAARTTLRKDRVRFWARSEDFFAALIAATTVFRWSSVSPLSSEASPSSTSRTSRGSSGGRTSVASATNTGMLLRR